jgi:magnesium transporter
MTPHIKPAKNYPPESVGSRMTSNVPVCQPNDRIGDVFAKFPRHHYDSVRNIYVINSSGKLEGIVDIARSSLTDDTTTVGQVMQPVTATLHPKDDQEKAVFIAVRDDVVAIPVVASNGTFLGAITAHELIDIMHEEHIEDAMLVAGVREPGSGAVHLLRERTSLIVRSRAPWLIFGLAMGMGLGLLSSHFEETLQSSIAVAYFVPVVAYVAGSVGAQSGAITVRALATTQIKASSYLMRELVVGSVLGFIIGALGFLGAFAITQSINVSIVVGLGVGAACVIASLFASVIPMTLQRMGKDPAPGSGPLATALMDVVSILVYFLIAQSVL